MNSNSIQSAPLASTSSAESKKPSLVYAWNAAGALVPSHATPAAKKIFTCVGVAVVFTEVMSSPLAQQQAVQVLQEIAETRPQIRAAMVETYKVEF